VRLVPEGLGIQISDLPFHARRDAEIVDGEVRFIRCEDPKIPGFRPAVPVPIIALLLALDIAVDVEALMDELAPMIFTYWS